VPDALSSPSSPTQKVTINIGGVDLKPVSIVGAGGYLQVQVVMTNAVPSGIVPLNSVVDTLTVQTYQLPVRAF
jgi:hypothetical protein